MYPFSPNSPPIQAAVQHWAEFPCYTVGSCWLFILIRAMCTWLGEGNGTPLQYCCLENPMDRGAWWAAVHGVAKSWTRLSDFTFTFHFHALEKEMATHSSVLAWRIPETGEPGGLLSLGLHRVRHDWSDLAVAVAVHGLMWGIFQVFIECVTILLFVVSCFGVLATRHVES